MNILYAQNSFKFFFQMTPRRSKFENENLVRSEFFQIFLPDDPKEIQVRIWEFFPRQTGLLALQNLDFATNTSELFDCSNIDLACNQIKHTSNSKFKYFQRSFFIYGSKTLEYWHYDFENFQLIFLYIFFQMTSRKSKFEFENFFPRRWIIGTTKFRKKYFQIWAQHVGILALQNLNLIFLIIFS